MQLITFDYVNPQKGSLTNREVLVLEPSRDHMMGVELKDTTPEESGAFIAELAAMKIRHQDEIKALLQKHTLHRSIRQFKTSGMSNIIIEEI